MSRFIRLAVARRTLIRELHLVVGTDPYHSVNVIAWLRRLKRWQRFD
jgi:hypothetical protein